MNKYDAEIKAMLAGNGDIVRCFYRTYTFDIGAEEAPVLKDVSICLTDVDSDDCPEVFTTVKQIKVGVHVIYEPVDKGHLLHCARWAHEFTGEGRVALIQIIRHLGTMVNQYDNEFRVFSKYTL